MHCHNEGADLVQPNIALLAWLEQQAGKTIEELDPDEAGAKPWDEITQIVQRIGRLLDLSFTAFPSGEQAEKELSLKPCPRADDESNGAQIVSSAIIGLFPLANQGLIRDTQAMLSGETVEGPIESFTNVSVSLIAPIAARWIRMFRQRRKRSTGARRRRGECPRQCIARPFPRRCGIFPRSD